MGGYGSGRRGGRTKIESCWSLDVNRLNRDGCLLPGYEGNRSWRQDGVRVASLGLRCNDDRLVLSYQLQPPKGASETIEYAVSLTWSPCRHGGRRPYFLCPGSPPDQPCGRRVANLYLRRRYFLCRHCETLCYASQSEARHDRLLRRRNKLMDSLSPKGGPFDLEPPRPKGMWHSTYEARLQEMRRLEAEAEVAFLDYLGGDLSEGSTEDPQP